MEGVVFKDYDENQQQSVNLLKIVDPKRDIVKGDWRLSNGILECAPGSPARLQIPFAPLGDYDLTLVAKRTSGGGAFGVGLVDGKMEGLVSLDILGFGNGFHLNDGKGAINNRTSRRFDVFSDANAHTIVCRVRKDRISIYRDGKLLIHHRGDRSELAIPPSRRIPHPNILSIGAWNSTYAISKLEINRPKCTIDPAHQAAWRKVKYLLEGPPAPFAIENVRGDVVVSPMTGNLSGFIEVTTKKSEPVTYSFDVVRADTGKKLRASGTVFPVAKAAGKKAIDLLEFIKLPDDVILGKYKQAEGQLQCSGGRLRIPVMPPNEYDLKIVARRVKGQKELHIGLAAGGKTFAAFFDMFGNSSAFVLGDGKHPSKNETARKFAIFADGKEHTLLCEVRKKRITIFCDGKRLLEAKGKLNRLIAPRWWEYSRGYLFIGANNSSYAIREIGIRPVLRN